MAQKESKVTGLAGATAMIKELEFLVGANIGADFLADQARHPNKGQKKAPTHEQVMGYLAEGGRSLYPNEEEYTKAGKMIRDDIAKHLKRTGQKVTNKQGVSRVLTKDRQAMAGAAAGLKAGAKYLGKRILSRIKSQTTTNGSRAEDVGIQYAISREAKYGVNERVVYIASGQLANAIASGKVKVYLKGANIGELLKNIE